MAVTKSGLYFPTFRDFFKNILSTLSFDAENNKIALFNNSITPNFSTDTAYAVAPYNANEITNGAGTAYTAGGAALTGTTVTESPSGTQMWDATDVAWTTATISGVRCGLIYADALAGNNAMQLVNFGADYATTAGTFTIQWPSTGILAIPFAP